jgi:hypothetical protein
MKLGKHGKTATHTYCQTDGNSENPSECPGAEQFLTNVPLARHRLTYGKFLANRSRKFF